MNELTDEQIDKCWDSKVGEYGRSRYDIARAIITAHEAQRQAGQKPYAYEYEKLCDDSFGIGWETRFARKVPGYDTTQNVKPLYTAPMPAVQPLTDEQIEDMRGEANRGFNIEREDYAKAVRDTEAAHGIGQAVQQ